jgi:hypothetical protein
VDCDNSSAFLENLYELSFEILCDVNSASFNISCARRPADQLCAECTRFINRQQCRAALCTAENPAMAFRTVRVSNSRTPAHHDPEHDREHAERRNPSRLEKGN